MQNNVLDYLDNIITKCPDKLAYCDDSTQYTFIQTNDYSKAIASKLLALGASHEPVLIFMKKSPKEIISFFGTIAAGCYYVPIDEEMPQNRISLIIENCSPRYMIVDEQTSDKASLLNFSGTVLSYDELINTPINGEALASVRASALDIDPIYIVFTSGSTGVPKGVCACHRSVIDYIEQLSDTLGFSSETIFGNQTPLYFDACLKELYPTLKFGATTYLIPHSYFMFPIKLVQYLNEKKINTICWVVSALTMISAFKTFDSIKPEFLKLIAFGSEVFPIRQFHLWKDACPNTRFFNLYGPTEGTGMCCYYPVERDFSDTDVIPIGFPFKNTQIMLLTDDNQLAPDGESGEICIRGTSVTLGYYNNPEKTQESFVQNPLNTAYPEIIYKTGDIGRLNEYKELVFVSRKDYQIKHMGHRIELGEIEANVNLIENVKLSGCIYDKDKSKIILYFVGDLTNAELTAILKEKLPRYMIPNKIISLDRMPLTANGKIDRVKLTNMKDNFN